ncbi:MAG: ATP-binding protein [Candidatus Magasanikbacteria bacterium]|nr:ATP-binding protein [Candidatus Magasanikbacteria bacterium]
MTNSTDQKLAFVTSVYPNKVKIEVENLTAFKDNIDDALGDLKIGSYLEISDNEGCKLIAIIESYQIELKERIIENEQGEKNKETYNAYVLEASPLGTIKGKEFTRGGDALTIPPTEVGPASEENIKLIYENGFEPQEKFLFAKLAQDENIEVPVNGNKFFNKHFAIVGSSGSGKSHTIAKIIQKAVAEKNGEFELNNSHIIIFDIHNEYKTAFPDANFLDISNLVLPYWLLNSEELEELFIDTEANDHNQKNVFKESIVTNKKDSLIKEDGESHEDFNNRKEKIHYDSPVLFDIQKVLEFAQNKNQEMVPGANNKEKQGSLFGKLTNFVSRLENKLNDKRFEFLLGDNSKEISFEDTLRQFIGYKDDNKSNVTIIDLSGVPFDVLSVTVALISRILFDYGYFYKKYLNEGVDLETPLLLIYEEAHKYVPKNDFAKFRASRNAIERIAKEGRKYGVTLGIISQRPSEISETIFSQCNNFIAMRLTNPTDQNYVKRLLPDTLGNLIDNLPSLQSGEGLLLGESIIMPSLVKIEKCDNDKQPSSNDVKYLETWKEEWKDVDFNNIIKKWKYE